MASQHSTDFQELEPLFEQMAGFDDRDPRHADVRERIITGHLPLAERIAGRYASRGIAQDDLVQVATVGLINAVDRFDPARGSAFLSYAVPTVMGEVRRYFRDTFWPVRMPRRLQELRIAINTARAELAQTLGRPVTTADLAEYLGTTEDEVAEGLQALQAFRSVSLDEPQFSGGVGTSLAETIGFDDLALGLVDDHESLLPLLQDLPDRERQILALRFFGDRTQSQIGEEVGLSQMHVSRLLKSTLAVLRKRMLPVPGEAGRSD